MLLQGNVTMAPADGGSVRIPPEAEHTAWSADAAAPFEVVVTFMPAGQQVGFCAPGAWYVVSLTSVGAVSSVLQRNISICPELELIYQRCCIMLSCLTRQVVFPP